MDKRAEFHLKSLRFGSKDWANHLLREGIKELRNENRAKSGRFSEVIVYIRLLSEAGYWWQARILRAWLHRYWHNLRPGKVDPPVGEGGVSL